MLRHFMSERFGSKNASARFSSQSWARFMIQKRQDIEEMTHPKASDKQHTGNDFKRAEYIDKCAEGQERQRHREQYNDRLGIVKMQGSNPEQDQAQADAQERPREPLDKLKHGFHHVLLRNIPDDVRGDFPVLPLRKRS